MRWSELRDRSQQRLEGWIFTFDKGLSHYAPVLVTNAEAGQRLHLYSIYFDSHCQMESFMYATVGIPKGGKGERVKVYRPTA